MADPKAAKLVMAARQKARSIDAAGLTEAERLFGDEGGVVAGYRVLRRNDDTAAAWFNGGNFNGLGVITFDADGPCSQTGTTDRAALTHWLQGHPRENDPSFGGAAEGGIAEVELQVHRTIDSQSTPVWVNAKTGEINNEVQVIVDGEVMGVNTGAIVVLFPPQ